MGALIIAAKATVSKVIEDAKQKVSEDESSRTAITEGKTEIDIKEKGEEDKKTSEKEEKAEQTSNWRDDKDGAKGLKTTLEDEVVEKDAQQKVAEDTTIKPSTEDDTKSDPEENKEIMTEKDERPAKEKQLDWKDDEDGAQGLKSQLLEDKKDEPVDVLTVAKETVTKVI